MGWHETKLIERWILKMWHMCVEIKQIKNTQKKKKCRKNVTENQLRAHTHMWIIENGSLWFDLEQIFHYIFMLNSTQIQYNQLINRFYNFQSIKNWWFFERLDVTGEEESKRIWYGGRCEEKGENQIYIERFSLEMNCD